MTNEQGYIFINVVSLVLITGFSLYAIMWYFKMSVRKKIILPPTPLLVCGLGILSVANLIEQLLRNEDYFPYMGVAFSIVVGGGYTLFYIVVALVLIRKRLPER